MKRLQYIREVTRRHRTQVFLAVFLTAVLLLYQPAWALSLPGTVGGYSATATAVKASYYGTGTAACSGPNSYCTVNFEYTYVLLSNAMIYIRSESSSGSPYAAVTISASPSSVKSLNAVNRFFISCNNDSWSGVVSE